MDSEEDIVIIIFMSSFNAVHTFTALKMEIILMIRTSYNNNQNLNEPMNQETVFHHLSKKDQLSILSTFFVISIAVLSLVLFQMVVFSIKTH